MNPNYAQTWNLLGDAPGAVGQLEEGLETHRRAQLLDPLHPVFSRPETVGDPTVEMLALPGTGTAFALAWLGRKTEALDALEHTFSTGHTRASYRLWVKSYPFLASLREEPRYREILRRLNLDGP